MKLYFQNSDGVEREIARPKDIEEVHSIITDFLKMARFKSYYTKTMTDSRTNRTIFDVGSHSEFFILEEDKGEKVK